MMRGKVRNEVDAVEARDAKGPGKARASARYVETRYKDALAYPTIEINSTGKNNMTRQ